MEEAAAASAAAAVVEVAASLSVGTVTSLSSSDRLRLVTLGIIADRKCPTFMVESSLRGRSVWILTSEFIGKIAGARLADYVRFKMISPTPIVVLVLPTLRGHSFLNE